MKKLSFLLFVLTLFALSARAEYVPTSLNGGTNNVLNGATNAYSEVMQVSNGQYLSCQASFKMVSSGATSNVVFLIDASLDGVAWKTNAHTFALAASGLTPVTEITNFQTGAIGYYRLRAVGNTNSVPATNLIFTWSQKPGI